MGQFYNTRTVFSIAFFLFAAIWGLSSSENGVLRAVLTMGTLPQAGVPGFGPNRIPSLTGVYALGEDSIAVYAVSEPLLFDPARWEKAGPSADAPWVSLETGSRILAVRKTFSVQDPRTVSPVWHFVLYFPSSVNPAAADAFMKAFIDRTIFFFSAAKTREALSFPATVEFSLPPAAGSSP